MPFAKTYSFGPGLSAALGAYQQAKQARMDAQIKQKQLDEFDKSQPIYPAKDFDPSAPVDFKLTQPQAAAFISSRQAKSNAANEKKEAQGVAYANQFRDEFNQLSKPFQTIVPMYGNVKSSAMSKNPTAASDMSLIFAYMKILDPNSTVREGEYATAQNAGSIPQAVLNAYEKARSGQKLQPEQRIQFANAARKAFGSAYGIQQQHVGRYTDLAKRRGVDPRDVVYDYAGDYAKDLQGPEFTVPAPELAAPNADAQFDASGELARIRARKAALNATQR